MNFQKFKANPIPFQVLMVLALLMAVYMIFSLLMRLQFSPNILRSVIQISLWLLVCWGFYMTRKWAWVIFFILVSFSILGIIHSLLSLRMPVNGLSFVSLAIGITVICLLNVSSVRNLFQVDERNGQIIPHEMTDFSLYCLIVGLFIFVEMLGISRIGASSTPGKLFISLLGIIHLSLGFGLWRVNKTAVQAALSLLLFSAISVSIVSAYDYIEFGRYLACRKSLFNISIPLIMLWYWVKRVKPKIQEDINVG